MQRYWSRREKLLTFCSPQNLTAHRHDVVSAKRWVTFAKTSWPWFIDHPYKEILRRVVHRVQATQFENSKKHGLPILFQWLVCKKSTKVRAAVNFKRT
jgi:hypothetical protein